MKMLPLRLQSDFIVEKPIGSGGYGEVYQAKNKLDKKDYAIKIVKIQANCDAHKTLREVTNLAKLNHPNIVRYYNAWIDSMPGSPAKEANIWTHIVLCIQMELCQKSLRVLLMEKALNSQVLLNYAKQICEGLKHVHENGIIHRDLKPDNIFIGKDGIIKLGDFGLSRAAPNSDEGNHSLMSFCGTLYYAAPEIILNSKYDKRVDLYSLGATYLEMCLPAYAHSQLMSFIKSKEFPSLPKPFSKFTKDLLNFDPSQRPSCQRIIEIFEIFEICKIQ